MPKGTDDKQKDIPSSIAAVKISRSLPREVIEQFDSEEELERVLDEAEATDPGTFDRPAVLVVDRGLIGRRGWRRES